MLFRSPEARWQLDELRPADRGALTLLPPLGSDRSGPLGPGLLSAGLLADVIRRIQATVGSTG